jgi:hypothetical protein
MPGTMTVMFRHVYERSATAAPFSRAGYPGSGRNWDTAGIRMLRNRSREGKMHGSARDCTLRVFQAGARDGNDRRLTVRIAARIAGRAGPRTAPGAEEHGDCRLMPITRTARLLRIAVAMAFRVDGARSAVLDKNICTNGGMNGS